MLIYQGKSVCGGIAIGKLKIWKKSESSVKRTHINDAKAEYDKFLFAKKEALSELGKLYEKAVVEVGSENAAIFDIHMMMIEDSDFLESVESYIINQKLNAAYAVAATSENLARMFSSMPDPYMQARSSDVKDVSERIISILLGKEKNEIAQAEPVIIAAEDLSPSETVQFDKSKILAFISAKGTQNSHTSILARTMNIPAIIGSDVYTNSFADGKTVIVDGYTGTIYIEPEDSFIEDMRKKQAEDIEKKQLLQLLKGKPSKTIDGKEIKLYANIGNTNDLALVMQNDADGIGLFRSEFIYMERDSFPSEEEQFSIYKNVAETMGGKSVIIRTLDIGADKSAHYFNLEKEENPALGLRAIRICLKNHDIFKTQLRALFRAAVYGNISVMYPMITSVDEIRQIKEIVKKVTDELEYEKIPYRLPEQGIMIETPAAAMISDLLAKEVSFFSIGTNDLSQYVMAIDRQNVLLDSFFDPHHKAVLRMIEMSIENAHKEGIWVGICGELAADISLTETFLKMGVDELSVSPGQVLVVRKKIMETDLNSV